MLSIMATENCGERGNLHVFTYAWPLPGHCAYFSVLLCVYSSCSFCLVSVGWSLSAILMVSRGDVGDSSKVGVFVACGSSMVWLLCLPCVLHCVFTATFGIYIGLEIVSVNFVWIQLVKISII
jgi:hypothetical protein